MRHIALSVSNLDKSKWFYGDFVGLRKVMEMPVRNSASRAALNLPDGMKGQAAVYQETTQTGLLELVQWSGGNQKPSPPKRPGDPGIFLVSFERSLEDLKLLYQRALNEEKVRVFSPLATSIVENYGEVHAFFIEDPDGVIVEFISVPSVEEIHKYRRTVAGFENLQA
jgi:catechol 2,3-dioxygenase-like lactoylglutathione lyase family enzyme